MVQQLAVGVRCFTSSAPSARPPRSLRFKKFALPISKAFDAEIAEIRRGACGESLVACDKLVVGESHGCGQRLV